MKGVSQPPFGINPPTPQLGGLRNETGFKSPPDGGVRG